MHELCIENAIPHSLNQSSWVTQWLKSWYQPINAVYRLFGQLFTTAETVCLSNHIKQLDFKLALVLSRLSFMPKMQFCILSNYKICINSLQTPVKHIQTLHQYRIQCNT